ncbi:ethanolamine utilization protein [Ilyonectria robusta]|uniref:ethanolamine utilization protein n=1 Tax=Ilyonectria robusta TaxID=1079257 RepID=UPI001E8EE105|nr:ethanolamine utilization protein [Ilyonectria robusta]KAH8666113.1 ethanolamine utilization protein [Ilyonectria robusta]
MPFVFKRRARAAKLPPIDDSGNAFGSDVVSTSDTGAKTPISAGFFRIEKGKPCVFTYEFDEAKFFAEGECVVEDETGRKVTARAGDVMLFVKGSTISFSTETYALAFYCDQRAKL